MKWKLVIYSKVIICCTGAFLIATLFIFKSENVTGQGLAFKAKHFAFLITLLDINNLQFVLRLFNSEKTYFMKSFILISTVQFEWQTAGHG